MPPEIVSTSKIKQRKIEWLMLLIVVSLATADQVSKYFILNSFSLYESVPIIEGFFNLTLIFNRGAAFGMFGGLSDGFRQLILWSTSLVAVLVIFYFIIIEFKNDAIAKLALALVLGGAAGNLIDRANHGFVVDFLDFYINSYHWPAFNLADSAICVGITLVAIRMIFKKSNYSPPER